MLEILPDGINKVDENGDVVPIEGPDKYGYSGNTVIYEDDGESFGAFNKKKDGKPYKRGSFDKNVVHVAGDIIFREPMDHVGIYDRGDVSELDVHQEPTQEEVDADEELLEGTSAAGKKRSFRMAEALRNHGFTPSSYGALTRYSLREATESIAGTAKVFNIIFLHQKNLTEEKKQNALEAHDENDFEEADLPDPETPSKTMFAVAKEYKSYVEQARGRESVLTRIRDYLKDQDSFARLADLSLFKDKAWLHDGWLYKGTVTMQMMSDADALAEGKTEKLPSEAVYFTGETEVLDKLDKLIQSMTVQKALDRIEVGIERYQKERKYFITQLEEVVKFGGKGNVAAIAAKTALQSLHVLDPEKAA